MPPRQGKQSSARPTARGFHRRRSLLARPGCRVVALCTLAVLGILAAVADHSPPDPADRTSIADPAASSSTAPPARLPGGPAGAPASGAASAPASGPPSAATRTAPPALGVQFHGMWEMYYSGGTVAPNRMFWRHLDALQRFGVAVIRVDVGWSGSQPSPGAPSVRSTYNRRLALVLRAAAERGMRVLLTLHQSPAWARPGTGSSLKQFPTDPDAIRPWATWMARTFGRHVAAWEVWNEPNLEAFTGVGDPGRRVSRYVRVLRAAATGLRAGHPSARVVFGGPAQTDDAFVRAAYAHGAKPWFDIMAVHPYQGNQTQSPDSPDEPAARWHMTHLPAVLAVMAAHGDGHKPVWWTEFGYSVHSNGGVDEAWLYGVPTAERSGEYFRRAFELARTRYPQVRVAVLYTAYKTPSDAAGHQYGYRLLEPDGRPRAQLPLLHEYLGRFPTHRPIR